MMLMVPLGKRRARVYFIYPKVTGERHLSGTGQSESFLAACRGTGADPQWFAGARVAGPLAEFSGADHWVDRPARDGVVLTGDAAAAPDPCFGSGLSMTMLDALHLRDSLLSDSDFSSAIRQYSALHDQSYGALHQLEQWYAELLWTPGPAADDRRGRVLPRLLTKPDGLPDLIGLGPASRLDDQARRELLEH
jgi:2-polyprenyl-6-methoxyphenol hydroxylase-like FAD-dependent oxidoreductase